MKIASGDWKWVESMDDGEEAEIEIKQIKKTKDGKRNYLHAIDMGTGNFFMANISPQQAVDLEGIKYAMMRCTGHSDRDGKVFFYYDFEVITDIATIQKYDNYMDGNEKVNCEPVVDVHYEFAYARYSLDDMELDLKNVIRKIKHADYQKFDSKYECIRKVEDAVVEALAVIYKNKLKTGDFYHD